MGAADPKFTFQPDGVHPNDAGQWFVAQQLMLFFGDKQAAEAKMKAQELSERIEQILASRLGNKKTQ